MFCENCGVKLEENAMFCPECGTRVEQAQEQNVVSAEINSDEEKTIIYEKNSSKENVEEAVATEQTKNSVQEEQAENSAQESQATEEKKNEVVSQTTISKVKYCSECGAANSEEDVFCYACGHSFADSGKKKILPKIPVKLVAAAAALIAVICLLVVVLGNGSKKEALVYLKDNEIMELIKEEGVTIGDSLYEQESESYGPESYLRYEMGFSEDGKYVFFPQDYENGTFTLYYRTVNDVNAESVKIDSDITNYSILNNNKVVYLKDDYRLYVSDLQDKEKVASDVNWYSFSEDHKKLLWKSTEEGRLYVSSLDNPEDKEKLDSDVSNIVYASEDLKDIIYLKGEDLYHRSGENKEKIKSDVYDAVAVVSENQDVIYYIVEEEEGTGFENYIDDDYAQSDAAMTEPMIENYQRVEIQQSWWGPREVVITDDSYYVAWEEYENKLARDNIREYFKSEDDFPKYQTIYCYEIGKKESEEYTSGLLGGNTSYQSPVFFYNKVDVEDIEKVKFSELMNMSEWEISEKIANRMYEAMKTYLVYNGEEVELEFDYSEYEPPQYVQYVNENKKEVYFVLGNLYSPEDADFAYEYKLFKASFGDGEGNVEEVAEKFYEMALETEDGVYYIVEEEEEGWGYVGELYFNDTKIDSDVVVGSVKGLDDGTGIMYLTDLAKENREGTLMMYKNGAETKIASDVVSYESNASGKIVFLQDYNFKKYRGELKLYNGKESVLIDSDVTSILYY